MYYPVYVISPFSQAKKKLSDSAKRLAITELILLIFNSIFYGIIISLLFEMVNDYSYFLLFDLIFAAFMLMIWISPVNCCPGCCGAITFTLIVCLPDSGVRFCPCWGINVQVPHEGYVVISQLS